MTADDNYKATIKPTPKELEKEKQLRKILGDDGFNNEIEKYQKMYPEASYACLIHEVAHRLNDTCVCRVNLESLPDDEKEELREKVRQHNQDNNDTLSVKGYLEKFGVKE